MSLEVTINGETYRIGKMNVLQQGHIAKRLAPITVALVQVQMAAASGEKGDGAIFTALGSLAQALLHLPDDDMDYVIKECALAAERKQGNTWSRLRHENGPLMFDDMDLFTTLQVTAEVVKANLGNFIPALGRWFSGPSDPVPQTSSTSPTTSTSS